MLQFRMKYIRVHNILLYMLLDFKHNPNLLTIY